MESTIESTTDSEPVVINVTGQGVLTMHLNRPALANALSADMVEIMLGAIENTTREPGPGVVACVISGEGKHFCAGFDLSELASSSDADLLWRFLRLETLLQAIHHANFPTIALAHGKVVGAGADLFAACWKRIAAPDSIFRFPGWQFALALGTRRLARTVGEGQAREYLIDSRWITSNEALSSGLATAIIDKFAWQEELRRECHRFDSLSRYALKK